MICSGCICFMVMKRLFVKRCTFCKDKYDHGTEECRDCCEQKHGTDSREVNRRTSEEGTDHASKCIGHREIRLSFDGIFRFHDGVYVVDRSRSQKSPAEHLENLNSIIHGNSGSKESPQRFQHKEDPRETDQEVTADLFDDISKEKQRRKFAHCRDRGCSTHFCTSSAGGLPCHLSWN